VSPSVVWIYKLDAAGRRVDTSSGFVSGPGRIITAFQAIDSASRLEIEYATGRKTPVDSVLGCSRSGDWAVLKADTGSTPVIARGNPQDVTVGERLIVFNVEANARVIGGVDIAGKRSVAGFGARIQISPPVAAEAVGGPLLDLYGHVVAILGGSLTPGARFEGRAMNLSAALFNSYSAENAATPFLPFFDNPAGTGKTLDDLAKDGP
jgi:S1-C subfamily serine protease